MKKKTANKKNNTILIISALIFLVILVQIGILFYLFKKDPISQKGQATQAVLVAYAEQILQICAKTSYHPSCYDREIPKLMDTISMEDAFKVTSLVQDKDRSYQYCHVLGHKLSAREVDKDPSKWQDVVSRCPSGMCSNGCIHGGFQEKFRSASLTDAQIQNILPELKIICEDRPAWHPTGIEQASCYHALGHLTMYMTKADIPKSNTLCDKIALKDDGRDFRHLCYDGVFMQIYQPLEPEDFALIKGKEVQKTQVNGFCSQYTGQELGSCISESWPLFRNEIQTPTGFVDHCNQLSNVNEQNRCFSALMYVITPLLGFDIKKIDNYCSLLPGDLQSLCYANASSRMIETDYRNTNLAIKLCQSATGDAQDRCYQELAQYATYNFHPGSDQSKALCNGLPEKWQKTCTQSQPS